MFSPCKNSRRAPVRFSVGEFLVRGRRFFSYWLWLGAACSAPQRPQVEAFVLRGGIRGVRTPRGADLG